MNIEQLRQSLRNKWLGYYEENRSWLVCLGIWVNCDGQRRPSSSFILATLSVLEPQLTQLLPLMVDLSSNPDRIVLALGLNFNPDEQLEAICRETHCVGTQAVNTKAVHANAVNTTAQMTGAVSRNGHGVGDAKENSTKALFAATTNEIELPPVRKAINLHARMDESCRGSGEARE